MRGLRDDALLSLVERERRRQEKIRRKLDGGCVSENAGVKSRGICCLGIKLRVESTRGASSFRCLDMIYNCEFCVIDGSFWGVLRKISRLRFPMTCFTEYECCFDDFLVFSNKFNFNYVDCMKILCFIRNRIMHIVNYMFETF